MCADVVADVVAAVVVVVVVVVVVSFFLSFVLLLFPSPPGDITKEEKEMCIYTYIKRHSKKQIISPFDKNEERDDTLIVNLGINLFNNIVTKSFRTTNRASAQQKEQHQK